MNKRKYILLRAYTFFHSQAVWVPQLVGPISCECEEIYTRNRVYFSHEQAVPFRFRPYLLLLFKQQFSIFKQYYVYFYILFHSHVFSKNTNNVIINFLPNGPLVIRKWYYIWSSKFGWNINYISDFYPNIKFLFKLYYMELYLHKDIRTKTKKTSICKYYKTNNI